ncbi:serine hydrolase FSH [Delphinella strobiligena]|nr:serine hydrolase FSH [Delphinella strobiligena]
MSTDTPPTRPLKFLMLHGFTQSGSLFHSKTRSLEKSLHAAFSDLESASHGINGVNLVYPTGPISVSAADIPNHEVVDMNSNFVTGEAFAWWRMREVGCEYWGLETGLEALAEVLREEGPFDGVLGFSQGAGAAAMVASLLEGGREEAFVVAERKGGIAFPAAFRNLQPPLRFAVCCSGIAPTSALYRGFLEPRIGTPSLHFIGRVDSVTEERACRRLAGFCRGGEGNVVLHPGGHFVPAGRREVAALVAFIRKTCFGG